MKTFTPPPIVWTRRFDAVLPNPGKQSRRVGLTSLLKMLPMIIRLTRYTRQKSAAGFDPINAFAAPQPGPNQGVPLGGIGGGSINRGWRGDFRLWQMRPGVFHLQTVFADQFSLFVQRPDQPAQAQVLFPSHPEDGNLSSWRWDMNPACGTYHALFPRAWTIYENPLPGVRLTCRQLSPVIPHNYRESSFPTVEFRWKIENTGSTEATISLMFTFQNGIGSSNDSAGGHFNQPFRGRGEAQRGVELHYVHRQKRTYPVAEVPAQPEIFADPLTFAITAEGGEVSLYSRFIASGDGAEVWEDFTHDGKLDNIEDLRPAAEGEKIGAALAVTLTLPAGESREVAFALAWDMPLVRSGYGSRYYRRYTQFYGQAGEAAAAIACDTLRHSAEWEEQIEGWQNPILADASLPDWYKMALFNELYYVVDGGTIWAYPADGETPPIEQIGLFAYLEGHEYRMYTSYDVHFYASFALAMLWPKLELAIQRQIAEATLAEYPDTFLELFTGKTGQRKLRGAVPHDVGWPDEDYWKLVNGYFLHDVNHWKDLNPKFVLQVYRDFVATNDRAFLSEVWPAVKVAMERVSRFDRDGDGLIENDGFPDQTYDVWSVKGPSAYTGGLWLAALSASAAMAEQMGESNLAQSYRARLEKGRAAYETKLWNGQYYNYDGSRSRQHNSIMADQLAGQWYAHACNLSPIVEPGHARRALQTVFDFNVMRFQQGTMGAVNGMRPDGKPDKSGMQSAEVWSGTTYAVAAAMLQAGLNEQAFKTAEGIYRTTYETKGYWFQTPEAWDIEGNYRSHAYMRPLAIWAMQWAIERG